MKPKFYWKTAFTILIFAIALNLYLSLSSFAAPTDVIKKVTWTKDTFNCFSPQPEAGVTPRKNLISYQCDNMFTKQADKGMITTLPEMQAAVCRIGAVAKNLGYQIYVNESYRPYDIQVKLWCKSKKPPAERVKVSAVPGTSNHGKGRALDIALMKNNVLLTAKGDSTAQCQDTMGSKQAFAECKDTMFDHRSTDETVCFKNEDYARILAEIVYEADKKFFRLSTEIWHFDYYDLKNKPMDDGKFTDIPKSCFEKKKSK